MSKSNPRTRQGGKTVHIGEILEVLHARVTEVLCEQAFASTRVTERRREWALYIVIWVWNEIVLRAPPSVTQILEEEHDLPPMEGRPRIPDATTWGFFKRCRNLRWEFSAAVFARFTEKLLADARPVFCASRRSLHVRFPDILILDGSRLDRVAHRLKITRSVQAPVLPGAISALYDPFRGILRRLDFTADAAEYELDRADRLLEGVQAGSLVIADRLHAYPFFIHRALEREIHVLTRPNDGVNLVVEKRLSCKRHKGGVLEDHIVMSGGHNGVPEVRLRWVRWQRGREVREAVTTILDPGQLTAAEALDLYTVRWRVEDLFYVLKRVMNLHRFYASNPNGVALQVYAAAMVYNAMRVVQGRIAKENEIPAEAISPARLFPRLRGAAVRYAMFCLGVLVTVRLNPSVELVQPDPKRQRFCRIPLARILVEKRNGDRRRRRAPSNGKWKSFRHIPGAMRALKLKN